MTSIANSIASLEPKARARLLRRYTPEQLEALKWDWRFWARDAQLAPGGDWRVWAQIAGRGAGKTRSGAEWVRERVESGQARRIALVAQTPGDARDVMIRGESGLLEIGPPESRPRYEPTKRRLTWPNGAEAIVYSGAHPDQLRGPQHDTAWVDELAAFKYPRDTWDNLMFGMRLGDPLVVVTTTPKPLSLLREILADPATVVTRGSTYDNIANLAPAFVERIVNRYEGTRTGRQELYAELLDEAEHALWKRDLIRHTQTPEPPVRVVVAIDPAATSGDTSNETGIVAAARSATGKGWVLADGSGRYSPDGWANKALALFDQFRADRLVAESNNGGEMVEHTIRTVRPNVSFSLVHASKAKQARAEPIAALYEQGKIFHVGQFSELEDQLVTWEPLSGMQSPDRLDALVWALTELFPPEGEVVAVSPGGVWVGPGPSWENR